MQLVKIYRKSYPDLPADACYIFGTYQSCKIPEIKLDLALTSALSLTTAQSPRHNATTATTTPSQPLSLLNRLKRQHHLQQYGELASHPPHHLAILRTPISSSTTQDLHPTLPIILQYFVGSRRSKMTKKKALSLLEKKYTPAIPHNAGGRLQVREGGLITGWMNNRKRGAPLKITPINKKIKGEGKTPTKAAAASTDTTKTPTSTKPPPTTMPPPRTEGRK